VGRASLKEPARGPLVAALDTAGSRLVSERLVRGQSQVGGRSGSPRSITAGDLVAAIGVVAGVIALQWPLRLYSLNPLDEGLVVQVADDLAHGHRLYRDAALYAFPGAFWLLAKLFELGGSRIELARTLAVVVFACASGIVFLTARWWYERRAALGVVALFVTYRVWAYPHWQFFGYATFAAAWALAATWLLGEGLARGRGGLVLAAGVASGLAVCGKQDAGVATTVALAGAALVQMPHASLGRLGAFVRFGVGAAAVGGAMLGWLVWHGIVADFWREAILAPLYGVQHFAYQRRPPLWPLGSTDPTLRAGVFGWFPAILLDSWFVELTATRLWRETGIVDTALKLVYYVPPLVLLTGVVTWWRDRDRTAVADRARALVTLALGAASWLAFNPPQDWVHLLVLFPPTILIAAYVWAHHAERRPVWQGLGRSAGMGLFALTAFLVAGFVQRHDTVVRTPRGVLVGSAPHAQAVQALVDGLGQRPRAPLAVWPHAPLINFLADRPALSRYYVLWPVDRDRERDARASAALDATPAADVVYMANQDRRLGVMANYAAPLFRHLVEHYEVADIYGGEVGGLTFARLERRRPPAGRSLLGEEFVAATVLVEPMDGAAHPVLGAEREAAAGDAVWPFTPVLRVATRPDAGIAVVYRVLPAAGDRFAAAVGVTPDRIGSYFVPPVTFTVGVRAAGGPQEQAVWTSTIDVNRDPPARRLTPVTIDLSPWAGATIELVLRTSSAPVAPPQSDCAGWAAPRVEAAGR
jgi:hypothetical protein